MLVALAFAAVGAQAAADPAQLAKDYGATKEVKTAGLDSILYGTETINGFNFPVKIFGMSGSILGVSWRNYNNLPSEENVLAAAQEILNAEPGLTQEELTARVYQKVLPQYFTFLEYGTELILIPKILFGASMPLNKTIDNKLFLEGGIGFPYLVGIGIRTRL